MNKKSQNIKQLYNCILTIKTIINKFTGIILIKILEKKNTRNILKSAENVDIFCTCQS